MKTIDEILEVASNYEKICQATVITAKIRKLPDGKYRVLSEKGKNLGTSDNKSDAVKRLQQVEYFKHKDDNKSDNKDVIDLLDIDEFAYSAIMRKLREKASKDQVLEFMKLYKKEFDKAVKKKLQKPEKIALQNSLIKFNKIHPIKLKKKLIKNAATTELGDAKVIGKYLSDIVKLTLHRISADKRPNAINSLKNKLYNLSAHEIASKNLPATSAIGQSITFIKHVLFNHDAQYVRDVLNNIVRNL